MPRLDDHDLSKETADLCHYPGAPGFHSASDQRWPCDEIVQLADHWIINFLDYGTQYALNGTLLPKQKFGIICVAATILPLTVKHAVSAVRHGMRIIC